MRLIKYCIQIILVWLVFTIPAGADIGIRIDRINGVVGETVILPVYIDTSLTTLNVISYQLEIEYNSNYMEALEPEFGGTLSSVWGTPVSNVSVENRIYISHAGTTPLTGTGVIAYLRFKLKLPGAMYVNFIEGAKTIFNEGAVPLSLTNGRITVSPKPYFNFSPNGALLFIGEEVQYHVSHGTSPYTFSTTNSSVATINSSGLVTAVSPGMTQVIAHDAVGVTDTSDYFVEVVPFKITIRDTSYYQNNYIDIPVSISSLDNYDVFGGEISLTYEKSVLAADSIIFTGTVLEPVNSIYSNLSQPGIVNISFASENKLVGEGVLFYIRFKIADIQYGYSKIKVIHALFNELLKAKEYYGNFSVNALPALHVSPATGELFLGESLDFDVTGGVEPYTWHVSDNNIASIDNNGMLTAVTGGSIVVTATDPRGSTGSSNVINVYDGSLNIGNVTIPANETSATLPLQLTSESSITPVISLSGSVLFNQNKISSIASNSAGTATFNWAYSYNSEEESFTFAGAGTSGITGNATLLYLDVSMGTNIKSGDHIPVSLASVVVNEGDPFLKINDGYIDVTTATAISKQPISNIKIIYDKYSGLIRIENIPENCKTLSIYNIAGQKVFKSIFFDKPFLINTGGWNRGIYLFQFESDIIVCKKIIL